MGRWKDLLEVFTDGAVAVRRGGGFRRQDAAAALNDERREHAGGNRPDP
jgi:hypothetical protein